MEITKTNNHAPRRAHCLALAFPTQGHANPMLHFCKRLQQHQGIKITLATTSFFIKNLKKVPESSISVETFSDGFDNGHKDIQSSKDYLDSLRVVGTQTLCELIEKLEARGDHVDFIVYDSMLPWSLDVAKRYGLGGACFLTQNLAVDTIYYYVKKGRLKLPLLENEDNVIRLPGLPLLDPLDMPSFVYEYGYGDPHKFDLVMGQFSNMKEADWVFCNTFYELEKEVAGCLRDVWPNLRTIGPTIPYKYLDTTDGVEDEQEYGFAFFKSEECAKWLDDQPKGSVVFVSFGSLASLNEEQMEEVAWGLKEININYVWVVRESEEAKLPKDFEKKSEKGLVVSWCHQMKVLSHEAIGCFVTHSGWNSTLEAVSVGVPLVSMPQWGDQIPNAKFIMDVWKIGVTAKVDEKKIVRRQALKNCIWEVMKGENASKIKNNAIKWRNLAASAVHKGGTSHDNIEQFVTHLLHYNS